MVNSKEINHVIENNIEAVNRTVASDGYAVSDEVFVGGFGTQVVVARSNYDCNIMYMDRNPFKVAGWLYANNLLIAKELLCISCVRCYDDIDLDVLTDITGVSLKTCPTCGTNGLIRQVSTNIRGENLKALSDRQGIIEESIE